MKDLTGHKFGLLTVIAYARPLARWQHAWQCRCACGRIKKVRGGNLVSGNTRSCSCEVAKTNCRIRTKHGHASRNSVSAEYRIWCGIKDRCNAQNKHRRPGYADRGISVCPRWKSSFANFLEDMGQRPSSKHSIERTDNDAGYCRENCKWATRKEQANNRRKRSDSRFVSHNGITQTLADWARDLDTPYTTLHSRLTRTGSIFI